LHEDKGKPVSGLAPHPGQAGGFGGSVASVKQDTALLDTRKET